MTYVDALKRLIFEYGISDTMAYQLSRARTQSDIMRVIAPIKDDLLFYLADQCIELRENTRGVSRGSRYRVRSSDDFTPRQLNFSPEEREVQVPRASPTRVSPRRMSSEPREVQNRRFTLERGEGLQPAESWILSENSPS